MSRMMSSRHFWKLERKKPVREVIAPSMPLRNKELDAPLDEGGIDVVLRLRVAGVEDLLGLQAAGAERGIHEDDVEAHPQELQQRHALRGVVGEEAAAGRVRAAAACDERRERLEQSVLGFGEEGIVVDARQIKLRPARPRGRSPGSVCGRMR